MENENLKLWLSVEKTDPKHTKKANVKGNNLTSIKPQYQIYNATQQWGSYGALWGFKDIQLGYELKEFGLITFKAMFYYPKGSFEIINTISFWRDNAQTKLDDEFAKKVETDSLTKALSKLGFNADVFMGRFDDLRYVEEMKVEHKEVKVKTEPNKKVKATETNIINMKKSIDKVGYEYVIKQVNERFELTKDQLDELELYKDLKN